MKLLAAFLLFNVIFPPYVKFSFHKPMSGYIDWSPWANKIGPNGIPFGFAWSIDIHMVDVRQESWKNYSPKEDK